MANCRSSSSRLDQRFRRSAPNAADPWVLPTAQAALAASKADPPAIAAVLEARNRIDLHTLNRQGGVVALIELVSAIRRCSPYSSALLSLPLAATIFFTAILVDKTLGRGCVHWPTIGLICLSATFGACVSLITRIDFFCEALRLRSLSPVSEWASKPIATSGLALTVYCILLTQIVSVTKISVALPTGASSSAVLPPEIAASLWIVGFIVGFSERLAQDLISRTEALLSGPSPKPTPRAKIGRIEPRLEVRAPSA